MQYMQWFKNKIIFVALSLLPLLQAVGQEGDNPFELKPRLSLPALKEDSAVAAPTGNPFDLVAPTSATARPEPAIEPPQAAPDKTSSPPSPMTSYRRFLLIANLTLLLSLTILVTLFRGQVAKAYRAFLNDNILSQLQREREAGGGTPYYFFYGLFLLNAGLFVFLLARHYGMDFSPNYWKGLMYCTGGVAGLFLAKHVILNFLAFVFPVKKEVRLYGFTIIIFSMMLGFFLVIANLFLAYAPEKASQLAIYGAYAGIGAAYLFRSLRGLFIANRFLLFHKFHFLLYICTVEIAPVLVLAKLIYG